MLVDVVEAEVCGPTSLLLKFEDGTKGQVDVASLVELEGVFAPLNDPDEFAKAAVHPELGTVSWPCGADLDPDVLYARVSGKAIEVLSGVGAG